MSREYRLSRLAELFDRWDRVKREFIDIHAAQKLNHQIIEEVLHDEPDYGDETRPE